MSSLKYIELKSGFADNGPAWIARVEASRSGQTIYFNGMALKRGAGIGSNHFDLATGAAYWVSGVKQRGTNRHPAGGSGRILVEASAVPELLQVLGVTALDPRVFSITQDIKPTDPQAFVALENLSTPSE